jgi:hypothetical protein
MMETSGCHRETSSRSSLSSSLNLATQHGQLINAMIPQALAMPLCRHMTDIPSHANALVDCC